MTPRCRDAAHVAARPSVSLRSEKTFTAINERLEEMVRIERARRPERPIRGMDTAAGQVVWHIHVQRVCGMCTERRLAFSL